MKSAMRGRLVLFALVIGTCAGVSRWAPMPAADAAADAASVPDAKAVTEIGLLTTATKADWLGDEINAFNQLHQGQYRIAMITPLESRDAMRQILGKQARPILWSPSSPVWIDRLESSWLEQNKTPLVDMDDPKDYGVFLRSPLVFLTTQEKAKYLRAVIGGSDAWQNIRELSLGAKRPPWGKFSFAYADPLVANSGMMTLGMILNDYALRTRQTGDLSAVANSSGFIAYLGELHRAFVYDGPVSKGSGPLADSYADNPSHYDFIATYESTALTEVGKNPDLAVVYPSPTIMAEQSVVILNGNWVTPEQKTGAQLFMAFLSTHDALAGGVRYNFRPDRASSDVSLAAQLTQNADHGFQQSVIAADLPPYEAINSAIYQWRLHVAHKSAAP